MQQEQTKTLKMMYSGTLEYISCPMDIKYEDIIEIAIERFDIPTDFKDFIQIPNEARYIFDKDTFQYFVLLFPNPEIIFHIRIDYCALLGNLQIETRQPFAKLHNKRKNSYPSEGVPVTRQNAFIGSFPGMVLSDEPKAKRPRTDFIRSKATVVKRTRHSRAIRI